jgi:hypothetical protein
MVRRESSIALGSRWNGVIGGSIAHPTFSLFLELGKYVHIHSRMIQQTDYESFSLK